VTEEGTVTWYAFKISDTSYGVFDTFETSDGLQAHIGGEILRALLRWHPDRTRHRAERRHCAPGTGLRRARAVTPGACSGVAHERAGPGAGGGQAHRLNRPWPRAPCGYERTGTGLAPAPPVQESRARALR